jgi:hypothetical protein
MTSTVLTEPNNVVLPKTSPVSPDTVLDENTPTIQESMITAKRDVDIALPTISLTPAEQRRKLPSVNALVEHQAVQVLVDWGATVNVINPTLVDTSKAIRLGPSAVRFCGALKSMRTSNLLLERALLVIQPSSNCPPTIFECWLCPDVEYAALIAYYTYESLYSGQVSDSVDNRTLTIRSTGETIPYTLVDTNVATVRAIQDQAVTTWSVLHEVQLPASAHVIVQLSPSDLPVNASSHAFELHPDMVGLTMFAVQAHIPLFDVETGSYAVIIQNMTTVPQLLRQGVSLLLSRQTQPVAT